ncbi:MAG: Lacal_2735 family protein [Bacteroidota bacterium]|nr:Lacal_2735 family protein [Bacteroidota bacterium]
MFGLFKRKSKSEKLQKKYEQLLKQSHELSTINRIESDNKFVEAQEVLKEIESIQEN